MAGSRGGAIEGVFARSYRIGSSYRVAFAPSGETLGALGRNVVLWDVKTHSRSASAHPLSHPSGLCWTSDGARLVVTSTSGRTVLLDGQTLDVLSSLRAVSGTDPTGPVMAPDANFVEGSHNGALTVRTMVDGEVAFCEGEDGVLITEVTANQERSVFAYLVAIRSDDGEVEVRLRRWPFSEHAAHVAIAALGGLGWAVALDRESRVAAVTGDQLNVWSLTDNELLASRRVPISGTSYQLAWRPGHDEIVLVGNDRAVGFDHLLRKRWSIELPYACSVGFSSDGATMALGSWTRGIVGQRV